MANTILKVGDKVAKFGNYGVDTICEVLRTTKTQAIIKPYYAEIKIPIEVPEYGVYKIGDKNVWSRERYKVATQKDIDDFESKMSEKLRNFKWDKLPLDVLRDVNNLIQDMVLK